MSRVLVRRTTVDGLLTSLVVSYPSAQSSESPRLHERRAGVSARRPHQE